jgi:branched-subunit amino acid ABC-type transport system permease component
MLHQLGLAIGFGLITASVLALAAVGVTLQFGVTNYVNFAYGAYMTLAGYIAWELNSALGLNIWVSIIPTVAAMAAFSVAVNKFVLHPFNRRNPPRVYMLIVTLGLWLFISNLIPAIWGTDPHTLNVGTGAPVHIGFLLLTPQQIAIFFVAVAAMLGVHLLLTRTKLGKAMRAMSDDPGLAGATGIDGDQVITITWVLVGILVGLAGCVLAINVESFDPTYGDGILFVIFAAVILGGIGEPYGTMLGALVIGLATEIAAVVVTSTYKDDVAFALLIVMLLLRPQGLIPSAGRGL